MTRSILITGGAGQIGTAFARENQGRYEFTLLDLPGAFRDEHTELGRTIEADLAELDQVSAACADIDTVLHLGGRRQASTLWSDLLPANLIGTYNVVVSAIAQKVRRVVFASSVHASSGYPARRELREDDPPRPGDLYGVTKCFGEALGSYAATHHGLSFVALRIGAYQQVEDLAQPDSGWMLAEYCAPEDLHNLMVAVIEDPAIEFEIFNAGSSNRFARMSMDKARERLGFAPKYDSFALSSPFRGAFAGAGPLSREQPPSGMRDDLAAIRGGGPS